MFSGALFVLSFLVAWAKGHGYVHNITIGGVFYEGYAPYRDPFTRPIPDRIVRPIQGNGPILDVELMDLQCGGYTAGGFNGTRPANLTASPAPTGSTVSLRWTLWPASHAGPITTYMARCPKNDCSTYLPGTEAVWFKIAEAGRVGTSDVWGNTPLMEVGNSYTYTVPHCLAPGAYIVRNEIIGLQTASEYPGAQFFPSCHQIEVTGSGKSAGPVNKVSIPGIYKGSDPGITYDMYIAHTYEIPGPAVFTCPEKRRPGKCRKKAGKCVHTKD